MAAGAISNGVNKGGSMMVFPSKKGFLDGFFAAVIKAVGSARIWRPFLYLCDLNKDGKNWFDYRKRIKVLESLMEEPPFGPEDLKGAVSYLLALEYENISAYYPRRKTVEKINRARWEMQKARALRGDDFITRMKLAYYHDLVGDLDHAIAVLQDSARSVPELHYLADLYARKGKYDRAIDALSEALEIRELYLLYFGLGEAYEVQGDTHSAAENYRHAMEDFPQKDEYVETYAGHPISVEGEKEWKMPTKEEIEEKYESQRLRYQRAYERTK
jgi:tetratricopeptide (TPR) repeat protein